MACNLVELEDEFFVTPLNLDSRAEFNASSVAQPLKVRTFFWQGGLRGIFRKGKPRL